MVWWLAALAFGYAFFHRVAPSVMVGDLMRDFAIGGALLGTLSALYFYPYVLLQIPLGALLDQLGARRLLTLTLALASVGTLIFALAPNVGVAYLGRILIGTGCAVGFLGSIFLAGRWFPPHKFAFLAGLTMFFGMLAGMMGQAPLAWLIGLLGWRTSMLLAGLFGIILAIMIWLIVRDNADGSDRKVRLGGEVWKAVGRGLAETASLPRVWHIAFMAAAMSGSMLAIGGLWGTPFLMSAYGLDRTYAAGLVSLLLLGWAVGAPLWGLVSDRTGKRKAVLVFNCLLITVSLAIVCFVDELPLSLCVICLILCGFGGGAMTVSFALAREVTPDEISGSVTGIVNSATVFSGAVLQPLVGWRLDTLWDGTLDAGSRVYAAADYRVAFLLVLMLPATGFVASWFLPTGERRSRDDQS